MLSPYKHLKYGFSAKSQHFNCKNAVYQKSVRNQQNRRLYPAKVQISRYCHIIISQNMGANILILRQITQYLGVINLLSIYLYKDTMIPRLAGLTSIVGRYTNIRPQYLATHRYYRQLGFHKHQPVCFALLAATVSVQRLFLGQCKHF